MPCCSRLFYSEPTPTAWHHSPPFIGSTLLQAPNLLQNLSREFSKNSLCALSHSTHQCAVTDACWLCFPSTDCQLPTFNSVKGPVPPPVCMNSNMCCMNQETSGLSGRKLFSIPSLQCSSCYVLEVDQACLLPTVSSLL